MDVGSAGAAAGPQTELLTKTPAQSRTIIVYKFTADDILREQYQDPWKEVRIGKLLEGLDALAGTIAIKPDMWTEVAKYLHGTDLVHLAVTCRWFLHLLFDDDSIWGYAFFRDLSLRMDDCKLRRLIIPRPFHRSWRLLYVNAFNNTHAYRFRQPKKHIEWSRIGGFLMDTSKMLLTAALALPRGIPLPNESAKCSIGLTGTCLLTNVRPGIWIADMHMLRCPMCNITKCEGTMQVLDARHCELYLEKKFKDGTWEYEDIGSYFSDGPLDSAGAAIFNRDHMNTLHSGNILNAKSWIRERSKLLPRARFTPVAVALNSNLKPNYVGFYSEAGYR